MLIDNGADLSYGDIAQYACTAAEQNSMDLLKDIINYGGDVRLLRKDGSTALHLAVCEGNSQMVQLLLEQGADMDRLDNHGWSPRELAEQQGHQEIISLFQLTKKARENESFLGGREEDDRSDDLTASVANKALGRFRSEPTMVRELREAMPEAASKRATHDDNSRSFCNSLFGIISAAHADKSSDPLLSCSSTHVKAGFGCYPDSHDHQQVQQCCHDHSHRPPLRVTISCPEERGSASKLVLLPRSMEELLRIGDEKFGFQASKVVTEDGVEVDDLQLIRDGDHLLLVSELWRGRNS